MKRVFAVLIGCAMMVACGTEEKPEEKEIITEAIVLEICDCLEPDSVNSVECNKLFPSISEKDIALCTGDSIMEIDTLSQVEKDSVRADYENDLSLEIKEIEEEKVNPISEDCKLFLEDYAAEIKDFTHIVDKMAKNPDDIGLQIQFSSSSEEINSWASKPQMFQCSQNEAFQKQIEILNGKRDKLLEM